MALEIVSRVEKTGENKVKTDQKNVLNHSSRASTKSGPKNVPKPSLIPRTAWAIAPRMPQARS